MLLPLLALPFLGGLLLLLLPLNQKQAKKFSLSLAIVIFWLSNSLALLLDETSINYQLISEYRWYPFLNITFSLGLDGIAVLFVCLTAFIVPLCFLSGWYSSNQIKVSIKNFFGLFLLIESFIFLVFLSVDILLFYVFFEAVLIPMFYIIGIWGSRERKIRANYMFFIYTLAGSLLMLLGMLVVYISTGSTNYLVLLEADFSPERQKFLWISFFISFIIKTPIIPFHLWLPEAHVEAPTAGSVLLAALLLKLGTFGIIRYSLTLFPTAVLFYKPYVFLVASLGVLFGSLTALRQSDIKRIVAYASVAHMNLTVIGLFSLHLTGLEGAIYQIVSHGIVSGALFICIGVLYHRYHTRIVKYYSGVAMVIPLYSSMFLLFILGNIALPGTSGFVGEFLTIAGLFSSNKVACLFGATSVVLSAGYSLWMYNQICYGNTNNFLQERHDFSRAEFHSLFPLLFIMIIMGIFPEFVLQYTRSSSAFILSQFYYA